MRHLAAYLLLKLGGNDSPSADDVTKALGSVGVEVDSASLSKLMGELEGKDLNEILATGKGLLATFGGGGGGGGGGAASGGAAAADEAPAEEEVEEEADMGGGMDVFGGGGGGGGDY